MARAVDGRWQVCLVRAGRYWGFPKGHVEGGESAPEAALREISEECGLPQTRLTVIAELPRSEYAYRRDGRLVFKVVHQFLVLAPADAAIRPQAGEIDEVEWLSLAEASRRASFAATRTALAAAERLLPATAL